MQMHSPAAAEGRAGPNALVPDAPGVSVVMAVYNGEPYLRLAIDSVLRQSYGAIEFIIIDDCSTDATAAIVQEYADPRIVYVRNASNLGQTASLNVGIRLARAPLVARIDADDLYAPDKLREQVVHMVSHLEITVCGTWSVRIDGEGRPRGSDSPPVRLQDVRFRLLRGTPVCHVSVLMRRDAVMSVGAYPERYRYAADYALWSALLRAGHVISNIPERLTHFRELPTTFGAEQKVGRAGEESAEIIRENARAFAGRELSPEESRDIALLYFPAARLSAASIVRAYHNLRHMALSIYGGIPLRVRLELLAVLGWSLSKRIAHRTDMNRVSAIREALSEASTELRREPVALAAAACALGIGAIGPRAAQQLKGILAAVIDRLHPSSTRAG